MADKPEVLYIAATASFPGYWGSHEDGPHHAIVECIEIGADRGGVFVIYEAYKGCSMNEMGGLTYLTEHGKPEVEGVYDATGQWLGENLMDVAERCQTQDWFPAEHPILSKETIASLKRHYQQGQDKAA